ncbi:S1C family serine protease [Actinokineospora iranica]|uniref:Serine protease, S1-C subfamily, contains C-terminal PDZ domain n=1 Tax=Actinokineospora iranica TaxID=1271860 RepID=A0A1G6R6V3_9PSEU|nr:trypsin-like peptidase domain-containing protein [Actinokineospora iranica]SDD00014.1 serine protease, S1-C subfamily, contains C-terminal PDZ domain [Actinokineospora iranica]
MNQQNFDPEIARADEQPPRNGVVPAGAEQRITPRPLDRPAVDPTMAAAFGRPAGVAGAFSPSAATPPVLGELTTAPPPPESLAAAFGRPPGETEVLQRPPGQGAESDESDDALWSPDADPWRDPAAGAVIGPPAVDRPDETDPDTGKRPSGALLSLSDVLFGRRVKPLALAALGLVAVLVGAAGGLVGWFLARGGDQLTSDVTLAQTQPGKERPAGSVSDIAKRVRPAVVSIEVKMDQGGGTGSGVLIDGAGYIVTNWHVVTLEGRADKTAKITTVFTDGTRTEAALVGVDAKTDLAVIKVNVTNPTVLQFGDSDQLQVGDSVLAIGSPLGLADTVTEGIVSALHRPVVAGGDNGEAPITYDAIQTDAAVNQGNSGGPLVDSTGSLVGINSAIRSSEGNTGSVGLGFAIPSNDAKRIAEAIIRDGQVKHADLGANVRSVSAETAEGAQVVNVTEGGAAAAAGIVEGDVIRKVGDRQVRNAAELTVAVRMFQPGQVVPLVLARQGRELTIEVTLRSD